MRNMEVLAPAGNIEIFKSVIDAGADAVYFGGKHFSARAFANNFDYKESEEALNYAHLHGKKAYLTLNTLIKNKEFNDDLYDYISFYYENGLDGIIVQDIGLIQLIRDEFPDLNVHGSTQLAICNSYGVKLLEKLGVTRIVPARELSLEEIRNIHDETGMELEVFVHGALCYCYSGDCLMSSLIGKRSGNRGRCAQPCRLPYDVYLDNEPLKTKGNYILSLKDLCGINDLPRIYRSGVSSLKIEGRMKQKQYATNVVYLYRKYVDILLDNENKGIDDYKVEENDYKFLLDLGNRCGFTNSYYYGNTNDMVTFVKPNHQNKEIDYEFTEEKLKVTLDVKAKIDNPIMITANYNDYSVNKQGSKVEKASKRPVTRDDISIRLKKSGSTSFDITSINYEIDDNIFIPLGEINRLRREVLEELEDFILSKFNRNKPIISKDRVAKTNNTINNNISSLLISVSTNEQLEAIGNIYNAKDYSMDFDLSIPVSEYKLFERIDEIKAIYKDSRIFVELPIVIRDKALNLLENNISLLTKYDGYIVSSYDGVSFVKDKGLKGIIIAGSHLYSYNNNAVNTINNLGIDYNISPLELNYKELIHRNNSNSILTVYGRYPMMVSANCINKNCISCDKKEKIIKIKDKKGYSFPVRNKCKVCYNVIYNDLPTCLLEETELIDKAGFKLYRIDFTFEDKNETIDILRRFYSNFINNNIDYDLRSESKYTKGHFKRGVE
ncbi:MAG: U32 family peptidase [Lachnospiraceae bacterium]|nr:U32 family peptidase [Lachnospiraceae bacterium]